LCAYANESIAEMNIYENLVNLMSIVEEIFKVFNSIVVGFAQEGSDLVKLYEKLREPKTRLEESRAIFTEYLVRLGEALTPKQSYAVLALGLERLTQYLDGASYRLMLLKREVGVVDHELYKYIDGLRGVIAEQFAKLYEGFKKLRGETRKAIQYAEEIRSMENRADDLYREATYAIYTKLSNRILVLMLMRDLLDFMEDACELLRSLGEELRYLALHKALIS